MVEQAQPAQATLDGPPLPEDKAIRLGHPSYVWGFGQERRLDLIRRYATLEGRRILDVGCGLGTYVQAFRRFSQDVYGIDIDADKLVEGSRELLQKSGLSDDHLVVAGENHRMVDEAAFGALLEIIERVGRR